MADTTTFIQKQPTPRSSYKKTGWGWFSSSSLIFFIIAILLSFGLFFYKEFKKDQLESLDAELKKIESEFEPSLILELQRTAKALSATQKLLNQHVALSQIFKFLNENTIADVVFSNFSYNDDGVVMSGRARSYLTLAQQSLVFEQSRQIKNVSFSNFSLTSEGFVVFSLNFVPAPELISYNASQASGQISPN